MSYPRPAPADGLLDEPDWNAVVRAIGSQLYDYSVRYNTTDSVWEAVDGDTGELESSNADAVTVIEAAMTAAAGSATEHATVAVKGDVTCASCLDVPDYTTLISQGRLLLQGSGTSPNKLGLTLGTQSTLIFDVIKQDDSCDINILITSTAKGDETDVTIIGKVLDGNLTNNTYLGAGASDYTGCGVSTYGDRWNITIQHIKDCGQYGGIVLHDAYNNVNAFVTGTTSLGGQTAKYATGVMATSTDCKHNMVNAKVDTVDGAGVFLEDLTASNTVFAHVESASGAGVLLEASSRNRIFLDVTSCVNGIEMWKSVAGAYYVDNNIVQGVIKSCTECGALLRGARENKFKVDFIDNAQDETAGRDSSVYMETANSAYCTRNSFKGSNFESSDGKVDYHIEEEDTSQDYNDLRGCIFQDTPKTAYVRWQGLNDLLYEKSFPYTSGTTYNSDGWDIDANTEYAATWGSLGPEIQQVLGARIWGRTQVSANAGAGMTLEIYVEGAADNEASNTHSYHGTSVHSSTTDFAAGDIIHWKVTNSNVLALVAGDSFRVELLHEAADGDWKTTDLRARDFRILHV